MVLTPSSMQALGTKAHDFELLNVIDNKTHTLADLKSNKVTVIMFICNHCPYVKHVNAELVNLAADYTPKGVTFIAINSNDTEAYPDDSPENMVKTARQLGYTFPYLFDETQDVAKAYGAACTPDFFVYDKDLELAYRGQLDDSRPGNNKPVTGNDMRMALDAILVGNSVDFEQKPSMGCNIKWR